MLSTQGSLNIRGGGVGRDPCVKCEDFSVPLQPRPYRCGIHANTESKRGRQLRYAFDEDFLSYRYAKATAFRTNTVR